MTTRAPTRGVAANGWVLGLVGILVVASILTIAICPDDVCGGVGKEWPWPWDVVMAVSFLGVAGVISLQAPGNRLAGVLAVIGAVKLVEMNLGELGDPVWWQAGRMVLIALVWHAGLSMPTGHPGRVGWILSAAWVVWVVVGWLVRYLLADPATLVVGMTAVAADDTGPAAQTLLDLVWQTGDLLVATTLVVLIARLVRGDRQTRRAMAPLLVVVPIVLLTVVDERLVAAGLLDTQILEVSQWVELAILAVPWGIVAGLARSQMWGGEIARFVADAEAASSPEEVEVVVADALGDPTVRLGIARPGTGDLVGVDGRPFGGEVPEGRLRRALVVDGETIGVVEYDASRVVPLSDQVVATIGLAVDRHRLQAEVRAQMEEVLASRRRVVDAADDARRQVERDLHDGAQQRLLALTMEAERLRLRLERLGDDDLAAMASELVAGARLAHAELRDLARGMYPPLLEADGLGAAVEALGHQLSSNGTVVVTDVEVGRLPPDVERAAYFVVAEALTNVVRHASAGEARVGVVRVPGAVEVAVTDDGRGGAEVGVRGSGLLGLVDRIEALGGSLVVSSPVDGGTTVAARIPLRPVDGADGPP